MKILIVENNPIILKILDLNLRNNGFQTILAQSTREALDWLESEVEIQLIIGEN